MFGIAFGAAFFTLVIFMVRILEIIHPDTEIREGLFLLILLAVFLGVLAESGMRRIVGK